MNKNSVLIENAFENLKNWRKIIKDVNACVDKTPMTTCACCPLHFFGGSITRYDETSGMWCLSTRRCPFGFCQNMHILVPWESKGVKGF